MTMFELVFTHQWPRITTYFAWLKHAFQSRSPTAQHLYLNKRTHLETYIKFQPIARARTWDNEGDEFIIPINASAQENNLSAAAMAGGSVKGVDDDISELFDKLHKICSGVCQETQEALLKSLMPDFFDIWMGVRTQSAMKSFLHQYFGDNRKRKKETERALLSLVKIYCGVRTFIEAAERLKIFKCIQCVPIPLNDRHRYSEYTSHRQTKPIEVVKLLGITVQRLDWVQYLNRKAPEFANIRMEKRQKRVLHAEIQALHYYEFLLSPDERQRTLPYIGCSKRCCLLCYLFVGLHGGFNVRGTHETIIHRWELPDISLVDIAESVARVKSTAEKLLNFLKWVLQDRFELSCLASHSELLAQSSHALSSAKTMVEETSGKLEQSRREIE